ncbi:hypothetical protein LZZ85_04185 [Terrimonas sp. NA20]|uniref:DUF4142 domain-containing protein n=1 Tax=Terrimonas ginsenosidimutans TaxID=2908004 RepID=A0ABS9KMB6_9BACT|nr:hypothetical protein [Terrimonas ginsenosidimutans]MCG2613462.1 hypothetical protein [Terrimonas ginsenosidimutans]
MTSRVYVFSFLCLFICSCNNENREEKTEAETPEALQDNKTSYEFIKRGGNRNLLEGLYAELVEKDERLKAFETGLKTLNTSRYDSAEQTRSFISKNEDYYRIAAEYGEKINDTVFKKEIKQLIDESRAGYHASISAHTRLLASIDTNSSHLSDLHLALKIVKTLPAINRFQQTSLPSVKPLQGYETEQKKIISLARPMLKK